MFNGHRIVALTPAGRRRYLEILFPHMLAQRPLIDEYQLWLNCYDESTGQESVDDLAFCRAVHHSHPEFVKLVPPKPRVPGHNFHSARSRTIHQFFRGCSEPNTIYIRFDDDIVFIAPDAIPELIKFRIAHPNFFLVFANIVNNAVTSYLHQRIGAIDRHVGKATYRCKCPVAWRRPRFAEHVHRTFLQAIEDRALDRFRFREWILRGPNGPERFSINCFAFFGAKFAEFGGEVGVDEERWLSVGYPRRHKCANVICGSAIVSHFAFYTQRKRLEATDILSRYAALAPNNAAYNHVRS